MLNFNALASTAPRDNYYGLRSDFDNVNADTVLARLEYDIAPNATITNQTRWAEVHRSARYTVITAYDPAMTQVTTQNQAYDRTNTTLTNLTNYSAKFFTGDIKHNLSVGLDLTNEESDALRFNAGANAMTSVFAPNLDRIQPLATRFGTNGVTVNSAGVYAYDTIEFNPQWQVTGGLRVDHYDVKLASKNLGGLPADANDGAGVDSTTLGGKFAVVYKPMPNGSVYGAVALSHAPPASSFLSNPDISRNNDDIFPNFFPDADPVRTVSYEVGTKWDFFDGRLSTSAALFYLDKRVPITGCVPASVSNPFLGCAVVGAPEAIMGYGRQIARGIEFGAAGNITPDWKVFGGLLLMETERQHSAFLDAARMAFQPGDYPVGFRDGTDGDELAFTPNVSANLWTTYRVPSTDWTIGGGLQYVGDSFLGRPDDAARIIPNGRFGILPSYLLLHAMTSYEIKKDVHIRFNVDNITDEKVAISTNWPGVRTILATSRAYRVSTSFRF
jgi:catecholate siderophore receptor